jgi:hypothetical protein
VVVEVAWPGLLGVLTGEAGAFVVRGAVVELKSKCVLVYNQRTRA